MPMFLSLHASKASFVPWWEYMSSTVHGGQHQREEVVDVVANLWVSGN